MRARPNSAHRTARIFLLAVVGWVALAFSAHAAPGRTGPASIVHAQLARRAFSASGLPTQALFPRGSLSAHACGPLALATPASVNPKSRIFVEGTNTPSSEALKADRLNFVMESCSSPLPACLVFRNCSTTPANRQRAP